MNLSGALSARHEVEVVSVHQTADTPSLSPGARVRLTSLIDLRPDSPGYDGALPAASEPSTMYRDGPVTKGRTAVSRLTDERLERYLRETDADVVIATRPVLNGYLARYGSPHQIRIGQEHVLLQMHDARLRADQNAALSRLDGFVTVSERDAADYRAALPEVSTRIVCIPNCSPGADVQPSTGDSRTVVAAGRLIPVKRYERLLAAFAKVVAARPDWHLRLYGRGTQKAALADRVVELGLSNHVRLMGAVSPIEPEWAKGAIAAVSSDFESFGMTILEAMHCGVPVVATDCPYGPGEIITQGEDGLLTPLEGGADALADALLRLIGDDEERHRLAAAARRRVADYAPGVIASRYERLIGELAADRDPARQPARTVRARLRRTVRAAIPAPRRSREAAGAPVRQAAPAAARCVVTPDGGLDVTVTGIGTTGARSVDLLVRKRKDPEKRSIRVPLAPVTDAAGREGHRGTVVRTAHVLAEGRWDCFVVPQGQGAAERVRLVAASVEQAALLTLPPVVDEHGVSSWIPYPTSDGYLAVRTWLRPAHAEVDQVHVGAESVTVIAELLGGAAGAPGVPGARVGVGEDARAVAVPRQDAVSAVDAAVESLGGARFSLRLPLPALLAACGGAQNLWDLTVRPAPDGDPVPLGRVTGDTVDRKTTDVFPAARLDRPDGGAVRVRPYFTAWNTLAVSARETVPGERLPVQDPAVAPGAAPAGAA